MSAGDESIGWSTWTSYVYNERSVLSLAITDTDCAELGTPITVTWGEADGRANPAVERRVPTQIRATVCPAPYSEDRR